MDSIKENDKRISGMIILNKGIGISSRKEIDNVGRVLNVKTGHIGTLDPEATGVLPVLLGNTCKLSKYLIEHDKEYIVKMQFGYETDTLDLEGEKIFKDNEQDIKALINSDNISKVILKVNSFKGKYNQIPPIFSAKKYNGQKLYDIAKKDYDRAYDIAKLKAKEIEIYDIADLKVDYENYILEFKVKCSSGTYIRSLVRDIAYSINLHATMVMLKRTKVDIFDIKDALKLDDIFNMNSNNIFINDLPENERNRMKNVLESNIVSEEKILKTITNNIFELKEHRYSAFLNGLTTKTVKKDGIYLVYLKEKLIGLRKYKKRRT